MRSKPANLDFPCQQFLDFSVIINASPIVSLCVCSITLPNLQYIHLTIKLHVSHVVDVKNSRMPLCAAEAMEGVVASLNRLPLSLVASEWVEQVTLKLNTVAKSFAVLTFCPRLLGSRWSVHRSCGAACRVRSCSGGDQRRPSSLRSSTSLRPLAQAASEGTNCCF